MKAMKKGIDDLTSTLPITDDTDAPNFNPEKVVTREHFGTTKTEYTKPFYRTDDGTNFAYAPPSFQQEAHELKLQRLYAILDQQTGSESPATQDMLLYIVTGVFLIYMFETFVGLGKTLK
jgi:hypothetical protein